MFARRPVIHRTPRCPLMTSAMPQALQPSSLRRQQEAEPASSSSMHIELLLTRASPASSTQDRTTQEPTHAHAIQASAAVPCSSGQGNGAAPAHGDHAGEGGTPGEPAASWPSHAASSKAGEAVPQLHARGPDAAEQEQEEAVAALPPPPPLHVRHEHPGAVGTSSTPPRPYQRLGPPASSVPQPTRILSLPAILPPGGLPSAPTATSADTPTLTPSPPPPPSSSASELSVAPITLATVPTLAPRPVPRPYSSSHQSKPSSATAPRASLPAVLPTRPEPPNPAPATADTLPSTALSSSLPETSHLSTAPASSAELSHAAPSPSPSPSPLDPPSPHPDSSLQLETSETSTQATTSSWPLEPLSASLRSTHTDFDPLTSPASRATPKARLTPFPKSQRSNFAAAGACIFALRPQDQQLCLLLVRESKRVKRLGVKAGQAVTAEGAAAPEGRELVACWNLMGGKVKTREGQREQAEETAARELEEESHGLLRREDMRPLLAAGRASWMPGGRYVAFLCELRDAWDLPKLFRAKVAAGQQHPEAHKCVDLAWMPLGEVRRLARASPRESEAAGGLYQVALMVMHKVLPWLQEMEAILRAEVKPEGAATRGREVLSSRQEAPAPVSSSRGGSSSGSSAGTTISSSGSKEGASSGTARQLQLAKQQKKQLKQERRAAKRLQRAEEKLRAQQGQPQGQGTQQAQEARQHRQGQGQGERQPGQGQQPQGQQLQGLEQPQEQEPQAQGLEQPQEQVLLQAQAQGQPQAQAEGQPDGQGQQQQQGNPQHEQRQHPQGQQEQHKQHGTPQHAQGRRGPVLWCSAALRPVELDALLPRPQRSVLREARDLEPAPL